MNGITVYVAGPITKGDQLSNIRDGMLACSELLGSGLFAHLSIPSASGLWHMIDPQSV